MSAGPLRARAPGVKQARTSDAQLATRLSGFDVSNRKVQQTEVARVDWDGIIPNPETREEGKRRQQDPSRSLTASREPTGSPIARDDLEFGTPPDLVLRDETSTQDRDVCQSQAKRPREGLPA